MWINDDNYPDRENSTSIKWTAIKTKNCQGIVVIAGALLKTPTSDTCSS